MCCLKGNVLKRKPCVPSSGIPKLLAQSLARQERDRRLVPLHPYVHAARATARNQQQVISCFV
jgi:hypothetical protein